MMPFLAAHGLEPGPTQRPLTAGAIAGLLATVPATLVLHLFGSLAVESRILGLSLVATLGAGSLVMVLAGAVYARLLGRAANDTSGGWLFGMVFGFLLWTAGAVLVLPAASGGLAPAGMAALGVLVSLVLWGATLGVVLPLIHPRLHVDLEEVTKRTASGPSAAASS